MMQHRQMACYSHMYLVHRCQVPAVALDVLLREDGGALVYRSLLSAHQVGPRVGSAEIKAGAARRLAQQALRHCAAGSASLQEVRGQGGRGM